LAVFDLSQYSYSPRFGDFTQRLYWPAVTQAISTAESPGRWQKL